MVLDDSWIVPWRHEPMVLISTAVAPVWRHGQRMPLPAAGEAVIAQALADEQARRDGLCAGTWRIVLSAWKHRAMRWYNAGFPGVACAVRSFERSMHRCVGVGDADAVRWVPRTASVETYYYLDERAIAFLVAHGYEGARMFTVPLAPEEEAD